jgi:hypothetical protein
MVHDLLFHALLLRGILWFSVILRWVWRQRHAATSHATTRATRRSHANQPFPGLPHQPSCATCEDGVQEQARLPLLPRCRFSLDGHARVREIRSPMAAPVHVVTRTGGSGVAMDVPTVIPALDGGGSCRVWPAEPLFSKRMARPCMARASHPSGWCGPWAPSPKGWASAQWPACAQSTRTPCWRGGSRPPTTSKPAPVLDCTRCRSVRSNWTNDLPCSTWSRPAKRSTWARVPWPGRNGWSIRSLRCWPRAACPACSPMGSRITARRC